MQGSKIAPPRSSDTFGIPNGNLYSTDIRTEALAQDLEAIRHNVDQALPGNAASNGYVAVPAGDVMQSARLVPGRSQQTQYAADARNSAPPVAVNDLVGPYVLSPGQKRQFEQHRLRTPSELNSYTLPEEHRIRLDDQSELDGPSLWDRDLQRPPVSSHLVSIESVPAYRETSQVPHQAELDAVHAAHAAFIEQPTPEVKIPRTIGDFLNLGSWVVFARAEELRQRESEGR